MRIGNFKETYASDEAVFQTPTVRFWICVLFLALLIFPFLANDYQLYMANLVGVAIVGAVSLNILTGFAGQISLGHAAFIGIGAYTAAIIATRLDWPFLLCLPMSGLSAAFFGIIVGGPSMRMKGLYLCIATLAAQVIFEFTFVHWESMTGGIRGLNLPPPKVFGISVDNEFKFYFITLAVVMIIVTVARNMFRNRVGRAFIAIRDRDISAEIMGINLFQYKMYAFGVSSFFAGIAGCLWVNFMRTVTPEHFPLMESVRYLAMIIVGGLGSILGAIYGAIFMTLVPEILKNTLGLIAHQFPTAMSYLFPMQEVVFGLLIVMFLVFEPHGLAEIWRRVKDYFRLWPFQH
ncbi:branched-chain amino acid ABC transporter permease [Desulfosarcina alkanivorans]|uniref:Branched-chain amino acid ABC transporter permease n=1 Tax=Desulfosarcina alkanivorans TaxID=571177 RepID=A0A5K7YMQ5_9BACT|nr:branched-chain amino acid ABC transporter permease [Desulfosarcina alkanivorans]BBO69713.1 branched-chain amino acid ABC transporter permease [Desulfosarcina alkanivorans]